jgi:predicted MFS family arabinose efflux permease
MTDAIAPVYEGYGAKPYRAYALGVLVVVYTFNFVDRSLVGVTLEPLKQAFGVDDAALGLLGGPAFAILYTLLGVPIARFAERHNRITIITIGAAIWSVMTAACGFAGTFTQLVAARIGVGIGEAACVPPSHSVIGDYFPSQRRASAIAIFALGIPIGTMIAAFGGGWLVSHYGWRGAFWALGAPGLLAALILRLTVREPPRAGAAPEAPSFSATLAEVLRKPSFWHMAAAGALMSFVGYSTSQFLVSYSVRNYGVSIRDASWALGIVAGVSVSLGTFFGGFLSDRLQRRFPTVACWLPGVGVFIALPAYLWGFLQPTFAGAFVMLMIAAVFHYMYLGPMYAVTQSVVHPRMRATAVAIMLLIVNLIGYGLGPPLVGALSDFLANRELVTAGLTAAACKGAGEHAAACAPAIAHGLRYAMIAAVSLLAWPMVHFFMAARTYLKDRVS